MNRLCFFGILLLGGWLSAQAQYTFMPNSRRLTLLDSLKAVAQTLNRQPTSFRRDTALFYTVDQYRFHYYDLNRPFAELTRTMLVLPDSMYRIAARRDWQTGLIIAAIRRADAISYLGDKVSAVRLYKEALQRCHYQPLPHQQAVALINLAACFAYRKNVTRQDWQQTVGYMKQALVIAKRSNDVENIHQYYNLMGDFHIIGRRYAQALPFYETEQPLMDKHRHLSGYRTNLAYLGICYLHTDQETKAWTFLRRFFAVSRTDQGSYATYLHFVVLYEIGAFYLRRKDYRTALSYQLRYERNLGERTLFDRIDHYESMSRIYGGLKDYTSAYQYQQRYRTMRDSLKIDETGRRFADMQNELSLQRKENQLNTLRNQSLKQENRTQQNRLISLIIIVCLLVGLLTLLAYSARLRKRKAETDLQLIHEQRETDTRIIQTQDAERQRVAADLHDDLGGTLATIRRRISDIRLHLRDPQAAHQLDDLQPLIQKSSDDLRRIAHNLMPPEFARIGLCAALEQLVRGQPPQPTYFSFITAGDEHKLPVDMALNVYRIVSELVHNVGKHAQAKRAAVQLLYYADHLTITVDDDGLGSRAVKTVAQNAGIGLKNSNLRAEYIGATLWREVSEGGTLVVLDVPYPAMPDAVRLPNPNPAH